MLSKGQLVICHYLLVPSRLTVWKRQCGWCKLKYDVMMDGRTGRENRKFSLGEIKLEGRSSKHGCHLRNSGRRRDEKCDCFSWNVERISWGQHDQGFWTRMREGRQSQKFSFHEQSSEGFLFSGVTWSTRSIGCRIWQFPPSCPEVCLLGIYHSGEPGMIGLWACWRRVDRSSQDIR